MLGARGGGLKWEPEIHCLVTDEEGSARAETKMAVGQTSISKLLSLLKEILQSRTLQSHLMQPFKKRHPAPLPLTY